jgi:hypothetical protein
MPYDKQFAEIVAWLQKHNLICRIPIHGPIRFELKELG